MAGNIGCFTVGCNDPVVGQCAGYKGSCGQFYCHTHSLGKLCAECGERKAREEKREQTYQDYLETSRGIKAPRASIRWAVALIIFGCFSAFFGSDRVPPWFGLGASCLLLYAFTKHDKARKTVEALDKVKPGFAEFYRQWKQVEKQQSGGLIGAILGTLVAGVAAGVGATAKTMVSPAIDREAMRDANLIGINNALDEIKKKL
jgi:hypothetical protein